MFGFLNIYKPKDWTSFDVVAKIRKITGIRSVGHAGTLDPFATGVLPICTGKATKLIEYLSGDKEYRATVQFGANTDTYDIDGNITDKYNKIITEQDLKTALKDFEGDIEQYPPIYSAIKINGKKLYEYARKGQTVEIKPRKVKINKIELINFDEQKQAAIIDIACSKGTYIRSIAYDIGKNLDCGGYLSSLERTLAGSFSLVDSVKLENLNSDNIKNYLINPLDILTQEIYNLNDSEKEHIIHGRSIISRKKLSNKVVFFVYNGKMYGVGQVENNRILVKKVFEV